MRSSVVLVSLLASVPLVLAQASGFDPSKIPASCLQSQCQAYVDAVTKNSCADLSCLCSNNVASTMKTCLQCLVSNGAVTGFDQSTLDSTLSSFVDGCKAAGHPVTISGVSGGSGASSGSPSSGTQTAASSGTTATTPATTKTNGAAGMSFHVGGLVAGAALAGAVLL